MEAITAASLYAHYQKVLATSPVNVFFIGSAQPEAVADALIKKGIAKNRLTYIGYGKEKPIAPNDTEEGRQLNRRTEFKVTKMSFIFL